MNRKVGAVGGLIAPYTRVPERTSQTIDFRAIHLRSLHRCTKTTTKCTMTLHFLNAHYAHPAPFVCIVQLLPDAGCSVTSTGGVGVMYHQLSFHVPYT